MRRSRKDFLHLAKTNTSRPFFEGGWIIFPSHPTVHVLLLMKEILHQLIGSLFHCLQGCIHPKWLAAFLPSTVALTTSPTHPTGYIPNNNHPKPRGILGWASAPQTEIVGVVGVKARNGIVVSHGLPLVETTNFNSHPANEGWPVNDNSTVNTKGTTFFGGGNLGDFSPDFFLNPSFWSSRFHDFRVCEFDWICIPTHCFAEPSVKFLPGMDWCHFHWFSTKKTKTSFFQVSFW